MQFFSENIIQSVGIVCLTLKGYVVEHNPIKRDLFLVQSRSFEQLPQMLNNNLTMKFNERFRVPYKWEHLQKFAD